MQQYHEVFIAEPRLFPMGGAEVFKRLRRKESDSAEGPNAADRTNIVVIASSFINELAYKMETDGCFGSEDALKYLARFGVTAHSKFSSGEPVIFHDGPGLDIAMLPLQGGQKRRDLGDSLDKRIDTLVRLAGQSEKHFKATKQEAPWPQILSSNEATHILLKARGIHVDDPHFLQVDENIVDQGVLTGNDRLLAKLQATPEGIPAEEAHELLGLKKNEELYIHQHLRFIGEGGYKYARVHGDIIRPTQKSEGVDVQNLRVRLLPEETYTKQVKVNRHVRPDVLGIQSRDMEQYLALQGTLDQDIRIMFIAGSKGSGKTLISYVGAVDLVLWYNKAERGLRGVPESSKGGLYRRIVLLKPTDIIGGKKRELGFMPGSLYDKLKPHLGPYIDAHRDCVLGDTLPFEDMLLHPKRKNDFGEMRSKAASGQIDGCAHLPSDGEVIEMTYSGFLRGRSFADTVVIVSEAQNFTPYELKTVIERLGQDCKIIIEGDPKQVDNADCSRKMNGLTAAIQQYLGKPYAQLVRLPRCYRSQMSIDAETWHAYANV
jgi:phosphate starvation-inducible protein PhoH